MVHVDTHVDTINREILRSFDHNELADYKPSDIHGCPELLMITPNGVICYNPEKKIFTVFDETYTYTVGETSYPMVAFTMLCSYCDYYLDGKGV